MAEIIGFPVQQSSPPDAAARAQALDIRNSFIVEAPAGSGKTGLLIQRYMKLLTDESVTMPEQVLAITFTNKAAAELRERVLEQLEQAGDAGAPVAVTAFERTSRELALAVLERDRQLGWSLLEQPQRLHLRTIDSVCAEIARTLPILSGSGGRLAPVTDSNLLHREAARRTLLLLGNGNAALDAAIRDLLLHRDGDLAGCESLIAEMLSLRDQWARLVPLTTERLGDESLDAEVLPRLNAALDHAICAALHQLIEIFPADLLEEFAALASEFGQREGYQGTLSPLAICASLRTSPQAVSADLDRWRAMARLVLTKENEWRKKGGLNRKNLGFDYDTKHPSHAQLVDILERLNGHPELHAALCRIRTLPPAQYPAEQWLVAKSLFRILSRALVELKLVFGERGECDFTEISLLARQALEHESGAEELAAALGGRLQHLLVDEMQDTSTSQYDLLERLTATWDGYSQTVFLVGDPHQSIYLFRQARVERFLEALRNGRLGDIPMQRLRLFANFRSQRTLVDQFNHDFKLVLPPTADSAGYQDVTATLPASATSLATVWHASTSGEDVLPDGTILSATEMRSRRARENADDILGIVRGWMITRLPPNRTKPWKIAVLVRSRSHLREIVEALRRQREPLPFRAVEIESLDERQEILDLTALTRALLHPADRVATLALLRAPWCGLPLADLYLLAGGDDPLFRRHSIPRLMAERGHLLPEASCIRMTRVWNILQAARTKRSSLAPAQLVERAWRSLGGDAWLTPLQRNNADRFFQLLDELGSSGERIEPALLTTRLRKLYSDPQPLPLNEPSLELLTIHKAKGLEWDVVIVPALERKTPHDGSRLLSWAEIDGSSDDSAAHIMLAPISGKGEPSGELNRWLNDIRSARETAEVRRLFYVASTRAKEELHLFATPELKNDGTPALATKSLLEAAWPVAEPHFAAINADISGFALSVRDREQVGTVLSDVAAKAEPTRPRLERVSDEFDPLKRFRRGGTDTTQESKEPKSRAHYARPEGSVAARSFGNVVHECLELLSRELLSGKSAAALRTQLPGWSKRISALLRCYGHSRPVVERLTRDVLRLLGNVIGDPVGVWLLAPHHQGASEVSVTSSTTSELTHEKEPVGVATVRVDRIFLAGPEPQSEGEDFLWIIDYKTSTPAESDLETFLAAQQATYGPQLEAYARVLGSAYGKPPEHIRLALYFPAIPQLLYWQHPEEELAR